MKKIFLSILSIIILISLVSCGSKPVNYKDTLSTSELAALTAASLTNINDMAAADDFYIEMSLGIDISKADDHYICIPVGGTILDEIGIFKASDESNINDMKSEIESYLKGRVDNFDTRYFIEELPKVESAEVKVFGKYIVYAILSDAEKSTFFNSIEANLK